MNEDHEEALLEIAKRLQTLITDFNADRVQFLNLCFVYLFNKSKYPRERWLYLLDLSDEDLSQIDRYEVFINGEFEEFADVRYRNAQSRRGKRGGRGGEKHKAVVDQRREEIFDMLQRGLTTKEIKERLDGDDSDVGLRQIQKIIKNMKNPSEL